MVFPQAKGWYIIYTRTTTTPEVQNVRYTQDARAALLAGYTENFVTNLSPCRTILDRPIQPLLGKWKRGYAFHSEKPNIISQIKSLYSYTCILCASVCVHKGYISFVRRG